MVVKSSLTNSITAKKWEGHVKLRIQLSNRAFCSENVSQIFCRNRKFVPCHLEWSQGKFSLVSALIRLRDVAVLFRPCQRACCLRRRWMMDFFPRSNCCYPLCDRRHRRDVEFFFVEMKLTSAANAVKTKQHFWELLRHPTRHLLGNLSFSQLSIDSFIDAMQWIFLSVGLMITY